MKASPSSISDFVRSISTFTTTTALGLGLVFISHCAHGVVVGPYSRDASTLHLWHLDETVLPAVDAAAGGTNLTALGGAATLGNPSLTGFGNALSTAGSAASYLSPRTLATTTADDTQMAYADSETGAFTFEAVVRIDFNPATFSRGNVPLYIVTGENDGGVSTRAFQFRMHTNGTGGLVLHIFNPDGNSGLLAQIPASGPNAIAQGGWYHAAATYNGAAGEADSLKLYWTRMDQDPTAEQANEIGSGTMPKDLPATATPDFAIGNVGRGTINGNFLGLIDEVRISSIARSATDMMFAATQPPPVGVSIATQPANQSVNVGDPALLSVVAYGTEPIYYQWRLEGAPIPNATASVYSIPAAQLANAGTYDVLVTNSVNSLVSDPVELTVEYLPVSITTQPSGDTLATGQPASFSVAASGTAPLSYQWYHDNVAITGATNAVYSIASSQAGDSGSYKVSVSNLKPSSVMSDSVVLTVHTPSTLTWLGSFGAAWDTASQVWDSNGDAAADKIYSQGDHVRFDDKGGGTLDIPGPVHPTTMVVSNINVTYEMTTSTGAGRIEKNAGLRKQGAGSLTLDVDSIATGATVIDEGAIVVGFSGARGSLGTGPVTNNGTLTFNRTGTLVMSNSIAGNGALVKDNTLALRLLGNNTMTGSITVNSGILAVGPKGLGNSANIVLNGVGGGDGTALYLTTNSAGQGVVVGSEVTLTGTSMDSANRVGIINEGGSNVFNGAVVLNGPGPGGLGVLVVRTIDGSLEMNGPISGDTFSDIVTFRGGGTNVVRSRINLAVGGIQKDDAGTWILNSTGSSYLFLRVLAGTMRLGGNNVLATSGFVKTDGGILDLAGFDQTVSGLANYRATPVTTIANSSTNSDSRLTVATLPSDPSWITGAIIADSTAGGTRKTSMTLRGGATLTLTNASTYSGDTTISAGTLALSGIGAIANSTPINLAAGTTLDVSGRTAGTWTINPTQTLKGDGAFNVVGSLINNGAIELKVNKSGTSLSNDSINNLTAITYGGTLKLNITASPALTAADSFKLFNAGSYSGAFTGIIPSTPALGLAWDTSTLETDGTLRIKQGPPMNPTNLVAAAINGGTHLDISWPASHQGWTLQVQTNAFAIGLSTNWFPITGSTATNRMFPPIVPANGSVFYRLVYP